MNEDVSRRAFGVAGGGALAAMALAGTASAQEKADDGVKTEFLFDVVGELEDPIEMGELPEGARRIYYMKGGTVEGPRIKATVLPGGGDWFRTRGDGVGLLDVRVVIKTDDDALIYITYRGMVHQNADGLYFRTTPWFETSSEKYAWLNKVMAIGIGVPSPGKITYKVYAIK